MKSINLGVIGLGQRGFGMLKGFMLFDNVNVVALSDNYEKHLLRASEEVEKTKGNKPALYEDYEQLLNDKNVQVVYIASSWDEHIRMAIKSMKKGIITAIEVGGAYDVEECWELVRAYEETKTPIMLMENCCFDYFELLATTLARRKMLGEIVHCHGSYSHDLRPEILGGNLNHHYRLLNYMKRNCENYPTHEFGPIAKILPFFPIHPSCAIAHSGCAPTRWDIPIWISWQRRKQSPLPRWERCISFWMAFSPTWSNGILTVIPCFWNGRRHLSPPTPI